MATLCEKRSSADGRLNLSHCYAAIRVFLDFQSSTLFVPFLDFDNVIDERLDDELVYLQELFRLGDLFVAETSARRIE